jgi:hypothetical protein
MSWAYACPINVGYLDWLRQQPFRSLMLSHNSLHMSDNLTYAHMKRRLRHIPERTPQPYPV